jgi:hypothetical protein
MVLQVLSKILGRRSASASIFSCDRHCTSSIIFCKKSFYYGLWCALPLSLRKSITDMATPDELSARSSSARSLHHLKIFSTGRTTASSSIDRIRPLLTKKAQRLACCEFIVLIVFMVGFIFLMWLHEVVFWNDLIS